MRLTAVTFDWGGEERTFDLRLGEVRKIEDKTGIGPAVILANLQNGTWKVDEYREVILQGLMGGGMSAPEATKLVKSWVDERPAKESLLPAMNIIMAWLVGVPQDAPKGKEKAAKKRPKRTAPAASTSPPSTVSVPS